MSESVFSQFATVKKKKAVALKKKLKSVIRFTLNVNVIQRQ